MYIDIEYIKSQFENVEESYFFTPKVEAAFKDHDVNDLLIHCSEIGASDIHIESGKFIYVDIHSTLYPVTTRRINEKEAETIIKRLYDETAIAEMNQKRAIDTNHTIKTRDKDGRHVRYRFRINATGSFIGELKGVQITIRTLASSPPSLHIVKKGERLDSAPSGTIGLEEDIWKNIAPEQGMILVTGPTGSGKSTLLAGIIKMLIMQNGFNKKVVTYEAPIEYVFDEVPTPSAFISQTEIPTQLENFYRGIESAMRRKPDIIFVGESRDIETMDASIMAAQTGHLLYSTLHTNSVSETMKRAINLFPESERQSKLMDMIDTTQMIIAQRLIKTVDGKRCAVKEYLHFDKEVKDVLRDSNPTNVTHVIDGMVRAKKQRLIDDIYRRYQEGLITLELFRELELTYGKHSIDEDDIFDFDEHGITFKDVKVFVESGQIQNAHIGVVLDKNDDNHGRIAFIDSSKMDIEDFKEEANTAYNFSVEEEKIDCRKAVLFLKKMSKEKRKQ